MTGDNFLREIAFRLRKMPQNEINQTINFYREAIDDRIEEGMTEEEAVAAMGEISDIIKSVENEYSQDERSNEGDSKKQEYSQRDESCRNEDFRGNIKVNFKNMIKSFVENVETIAKNTFNGEYEHYSTEESLYYIEINDKNTEITVKQSEDNMIHLHYCIDEDFYYEIDDSIQGELKVSKVSKKKWGDVSSEPVQLYLPESFNGNININTTNDEISIQDICAEKLVCHTTNDEINLTHVKVSNDCELTTKNDEINVKNVEFGNYAALRTTNDHIYLWQVTVCKSLKCTTTNDSIKGSIYGRIEDFNVASFTTNGTNNLRNSGSHDGLKDLSVNTTNSDIHIEFI